MTDVKVSFKTKSHAEAYRRAAMMNLEFNSKAARLRDLLAGKSLSTENLTEEARDILLGEGIHPEQTPRVRTHKSA